MIGFNGDRAGSGVKCASRKMHSRMFLARASHSVRVCHVFENASNCAFPSSSVNLGSLSGSVSAAGTSDTIAVEIANQIDQRLMMFITIPQWLCLYTTLPICLQQKCCDLDIKITRFYRHCCDVATSKGDHPPDHPPCRPGLEKKSLT